MYYSLYKSMVIHNIKYIILPVNPFGVLVKTSDILGDSEALT